MTLYVYDVWMYYNVQSKVHAPHNYKREDTILFTKKKKKFFLDSLTVVHCQYTTLHVRETIASENKVHN